MKFALLAITPLAPIVFLAAATVGPIGRAAAQQAPPPTTLTGMFETDLADVKHPEALKAAVDQAKGEGRFKGDGACYPPSGLRAKFTVRMKQDGADRLFVETLAKARAEAIKQSLHSSGIDDSRFTTDSEVGSDDDVRVTYREFDNTDPPVFYRLKSDPETGSRVKAGDKITVSIVASERYEDGHKGWPNGVTLIQVTDKAGFDESKPFPNPYACTRAPFETTYTVPDNPPKIVQLTALADDAVGNKNPEIGNFPTVAGFKFSGVRFDWPFYHFYDDISGRVCGNPYKNPWRVSFTNTNTTTGETGTVSLSGPGSGIQLHGETLLSLTFPPNPPPLLKVTRYTRIGPQEKTVPLEEDESCKGTEGGGRE